MKMESIKEMIRRHQKEEDKNYFDAVYYKDESKDLPQKHGQTFRDSILDDDAPKAYFSAYEWLAVILLVSGAFYAYFGIDIVACVLTRMFASIGHSSAQYLMGQRYLTGATVTKNHTLAIEWFRLAASKGHASASYNLAVSHFQGYRAGLAPGEAMELLKYAASRGVLRAIDVLATCERDKLCSD